MWHPKQIPYQYPDGYQDGNQLPESKPFQNFPILINYEMFIKILRQLIEFRRSGFGIPEKIQVVIQIGDKLQNSIIISLSHF